MDTQTTSLKKFFKVSLFLGLVSILLALLAQKILPPQIPLFYGLPESEGQLASALQLIIPGVFSLTITVFNFGLLTLVKDNFLQKALLLASLLAGIFALITTIKIIFLVGSL
jgi:uncharacterized protein YqhQ